MSKANRERMYQWLVNNDALGLVPGLSQDDGALAKEFGKAGMKADASFSDMTKKELFDACRMQSIETKSNMTKDDLVVLLENKSDDEKVL